MNYSVMQEAMLTKEDKVVTRNKKVVPVEEMFPDEKVSVIERTSAMTDSVAEFKSSSAAATEVSFSAASTRAAANAAFAAASA